MPVAERYRVSILTTARRCSIVWTGEIDPPGRQRPDLRFPSRFRGPLSVQGMARVCRERIGRLRDRAPGLSERGQDHDPPSDLRSSQLQKRSLRLLSNDSRATKRDGDLPWRAPLDDFSRTCARKPGRPVTWPRMRGSRHWLSSQVANGSRPTGTMLASRGSLGEVLFKVPRGGLLQWFSAPAKSSTTRTATKTGYSSRFRRAPRLRRSTSPVSRGALKFRA